jgi:hypothetical protein
MKKPISRNTRSQHPIATPDLDEELFTDGFVLLGGGGLQQRI